MPSGPGDEDDEHLCKVCLINRGVTGKVSNSRSISGEGITSFIQIGSDS